jgi:Flp pilus assembly protein TadD
MYLGDAALERSQAFLAPSTATTARDELQQGFSESPDHEGVVGALGRLEMLLGRHAESLSPLFLAVELNPWDVDNHNRLAEAFDNLHMDGEAKAHRQLARHLQGNGHNLKYESPAQTSQIQTA